MLFRCLVLSYSLVHWSLACKVLSPSIVCRRVLLHAPSPFWLSAIKIVYLTRRRRLIFARYRPTLCPPSPVCLTFILTDISFFLFLFLRPFTTSHRCDCSFSLICQKKYFFFSRIPMTFYLLSMWSYRLWLITFMRIVTWAKWFIINKLRDLLSLMGGNKLLFARFSSVNVYHTITHESERYSQVDTARLYWYFFFSRWCKRISYQTKDTNKKERSSK